jgi:hypothetical protein
VAFGTGTVVAREDWRGYLHSAVPRLVVADDGSALVDWAPAGTGGVYPSSCHYPGREHLPRSERKLLTLETCQWLYSSLASETNALSFLDDQNSSSTTLGWSQDGDFLGGGCPARQSKSSRSSMTTGTWTDYWSARSGSSAPILATASS